MLNRGVAKFDLGNKKDAIEDYNTVIHLKPDGNLLTTAYLNRGVVKSDLGDKQGAIEDYNTVIHLKPEDNLLALVYVNRGVAKSDLGNKQGAIEDSSTAIRLKPSDTILAAAHNIRGKAKAAQGDNEGSIVDYDRAIQLEPSHPQFYYNRGVAKTALGHTVAAKTDLKTALKLLEREIGISKSRDKETASSDLEFHLTVRSGLKTDIEKALGDLE